MNLLLITGKLAEERVRAVASRHGAGVYAMNVEVAGFITPRMVVEEFKGKKLGESYDAMILPGIIAGDLSSVERELKLKAFKGTRDIAMMDPLLEGVESLRLSPRVAADELLRKEMEERAMAELTEVEEPEKIRELLKHRGNFTIGGLAVGKDFPMRVVAEIPYIEKLGRKELVEKASYFSESGADIIDLGIGRRSPEGVEEAVRELKDLEAPLSVDTMERENIEAAIDAGVDLVLSFSRELIEELPGVKIPSVVVPLAQGRLPHRAEERVKLLEENISLASDTGYARVIADPVLNHPSYGLGESLAAYRSFARRNRDFPTLFGSGNVTELLDADSTGANALLASIASEVGADLLFTTEASDKATGSVEELATASRMMFLSRRWGSAPKDLGIDLLIMKEKRILRDPLPDEVLHAKKVEAGGKSTYREDERGYFRIFMWDKIYAAHYRKGKLNLVITGESAEEVSREIGRHSLVSEPSHGLYLGRELEKAEFALKYKRSYYQS